MTTGEQHLVDRVGWLRAAVLGANDGIVSTASLIAGVASAGSSPKLIALAGIAGFFVLPVSPLPQVDYPAISVSASIPGASPDVMANSVATPLERRLATISGVNEITSSSGTGSTRVSMQFDLNRDIATGPARPHGVAVVSR